MPLSRHLAFATDESYHSKNSLRKRQTYLESGGQRIDGEDGVFRLSALDAGTVRRKQTLCLRFEFRQQALKWSDEYNI
jgi:hypothetical protein